MMPLQRACGAESQVRNKLSNGPLRAQSKERNTSPSILRRRRQAYNCRGYKYFYRILLKSTVFSVNQGGTADSVASFVCFIRP